MLETKIFKSEKDFWHYNGMKDNRPNNLDGGYTFSNNIAYKTIYAKDLA